MQCSQIREFPADRAPSREVVDRLIHRSRGLMGKGLSFQPVNGKLPYSGGISVIDGAAIGPEIRGNG